MTPQLKAIYNEIQTCQLSETCLASCRSQDKSVRLKPQKNLWIGKKYEQGRIMLAGINRNVGGTKYAHLEHEIEEWVRGIIQELAEFRSGRAGKDHWLKGIKLAVERFLDQKMRDDEETFQHLCFTEAIKCSPDWQLSFPTQGMIKSCLYEMKYLKQEIEILKPRLVIAFGSDTARLISGMYKEGNHSDNPENDSDVYKIMNGNHSFCIVGIFHPSHPRFPRMVNKYLSMSLEALRSDLDLRDKISEELIRTVKEKTRHTDYFRNLFELGLIDEAKNLLKEEIHA